MLAQAIVTRGYLYAAMLVILLYAAIKSGAVVPVPLDREAEVNPVIISNVERMLAMALGLGLFIVAMAVLWPSLFPAGGAVAGYVGL